MWSVLLRALVYSLVLLTLAVPLCAEEATSFKDEYDAIVRDFHREASAARGNRRRLMDAKLRFDARLGSCLERIKVSSGGSPAAKDLIVAVAIAERLSKSREVVSMCDQILRQDPDCDAAVYAKLRGLLGLGRLDDAERHVRHVLRGANELSDYFSMCGLLLAAFEERRQWQKGVECGAPFLTWCSRKIRAQGTLDVSVSSFLDLFAHCAEEAHDRRQVDRLAEEMLGDVTAAIKLAKAKENAGGAGVKQLEFLFRLKHHLCCLSPDSDPGACVAEWLAALANPAGQAESPAAAAAIVNAANAGVSSLCLARDLDAVRNAARDCRSAFESLKPVSKTGEPANSGVAAIRRLEKLIEIEQAVRGMKGKALDVLDKAEWHHRPEKNGVGLTVVYIWSPSGRDPGLTLRQNLSKIRDATPLPLIVVSPYTETPAAAAEDAAAKRRQEEGAAIRKTTAAIGDEIAVACIDGKLLSEKLPAAALPQVYLLDATGKVELALAGIDRWRLKSLREAGEKRSHVGKH